MDAVQREGVGARIAALRKERGWSQDRLAKEAKVSARTVFAIEKGERDPQPAKLRAVLDALGVPVPQSSSELVIEGMPDDIAVFLRVAAQRLSVLDHAARAQVLAEIYPKLIGEIGGQSRTQE